MKNVLLTCSAAVLVVCGVSMVWPSQGVVEASPARSVGSTPVCKDADQDGFGLGCAAGDDCNDLDASINPDQREICNFRDDDCNTLVDDAAGCTAPPLDPSPVVLPAGRFLMGSDTAVDDEAPAHMVRLDEVLIDRYEVTNRRYQACAESGHCDPPVFLSSRRRSDYFENPAFADYPVIYVNWDQARTFCEFVDGRLPTEAEWEKAARGDDGLPQTFPWGDNEPSCALANLGGKGSCVGDTDRVGRRPEGQSPYGAMDMAGNVWEWVSDWYDPEYYDESPERDPKGPPEGRLKVMRGGCWMSGRDSLRVSCRKAELPSTWAHNVGFRCAYDQEVAR